MVPIRTVPQTVLLVHCRETYVVHRPKFGSFWIMTRSQRHKSDGATGLESLNPINQIRGKSVFSFNKLPRAKGASSRETFRREGKKAREEWNKGLLRRPRSSLDIRHSRTETRNRYGRYLPLRTPLRSFDTSTLCITKAALGDVPIYAQFHFQNRRNTPGSPASHLYYFEISTFSSNALVGFTFVPSYKRASRGYYQRCCEASGWDIRLVGSVFQVRMFSTE